MTYRAAHGTATATARGKMCRSTVSSKLPMAFWLRLLRTTSLALLSTAGCAPFCFLTPCVVVDNRWSGAGLWRTVNNENKTHLVRKGSKGDLAEIVGEVNELANQFSHKGIAPPSGHNGNAILLQLANAFDAGLEIPRRSWQGMADVHKLGAAIMRGMQTVESMQWHVCVPRARTECVPSNVLPPAARMRNSATCTCPSLPTLLNSANPREQRRGCLTSPRATPLSLFRSLR
ncbi:hypothetical protein TRVL_10395 [Trypanosoma vivax]|nr:hypothetical protein TRVL_10395 [Trypanosoma vivax]